ncbi:MAG TPA: SUMF1/EgtB/PvdO family nonheme iron enzyme [Prosthecobacter sp.]|nr:SUMF1/EgtB/PvdO family nonheme iron enzyme [Prosthecobacter sp.]
MHHIFGMVRPPRQHPPTEQLADTLVAAPGHYNAPELERHGIADARADIYSLGALLYHLLTGEPPRAHYLPASRMYAGSLITPRLDEIIARALQTDPARRFASMAEMAAQLRREEARIMEFLADPGARRRRLWRAATVLVLVCLIAWGTSAGYRAHRASQARRTLLARMAPVPADWKPERWTNSLGMEFVSIPDCEVMFCIWETRVKDFEEYSQMNPGEERAWAADTGFAFPRKEPCFALVKGTFTAGIHTWRDPGFETGPMHPVCGVSLFDAEAFCMWLTWRERTSGKIKEDQSYRLPTDDEWSSAAGLRKEPGTTPDERLASWAGGRLLFEWGEDFTPVPPSVNVAGREVAKWEHWPWPWVRVPRVDPWLGTATVDSARASPLGLYHLTGNVWEWTETPINLENQSRIITLRGGSWTNSLPEHLSLMARDSDRGEVRMTKRGFRIVFQHEGAQGWRYGGPR